jgi:hypothetical protein
MAEVGRFAELPESITLALSEVALVLGALDRAAERLEPESDDHRAVRVATRLITKKVWPELGDLLDEDDQ